jgi:TetR/AcrR family transcriptional regulator, transcriptional repressor for nem operon
VERVQSNDQHFTSSVPKPTKRRLLDAGMAMMLEHGYSDLGIQALLDRTGAPKGSFYHHFKSKQDFALQVVDRYMVEVHAGLDACLNADGVPPLARVRRFFELSRDKYQREGNLGCLLGALGQELAGVNATFRARIEGCLSYVSLRVSGCFALARERGDLPAEIDPRELADLFLNCWEGAALRSRMRRDPAPLTDMLDFFFDRYDLGSPTH